MLQYWQLLNLDKRETLGQCGDFPEFLASPSTPDAILPLFASNMLSHPSSWAGDRVICISDYAITYPKGLLTDKELDEIEDMYLDEDNGDEYAGDDPAPTLFSFAEEWYFLRQSHLSGPSGSQNQFRKGGIGKDAKKAWYLRNLTKKEYVRSDLLGDCPQLPWQTDSDPSQSNSEERSTNSNNAIRGLCQALLLCTSWSSELETIIAPLSPKGGKPKAAAGEQEKIDVGQGKWAGDRLDIRCASELDKADLESWKDVSVEVGKELGIVWKTLGVF
ncbi:hypothetical protein AMATHDRAFT_59854 [Amanita thiersii Skay4041]|uniref:Uncharacterized protein n=1 Tax=Amanita thiersii Skay4041 TaxID=703135 RepID=A0A2A9NK77_9AGAR|nr:hypothetical protein AMATHDRAFT_59854 [Amanita thiersii Skay4041]